MDIPSSFWYGLLVVLILLSALFSGSETALTAISKARIRRLKEEKVKGAELLEKLLLNTPRLISTILLGNTLVNLLAASVATNIAVKVYGNLGIGIATGIMTFLILVFAEITPKTYAINHPDKVALFAVWFISALSYILYPLSKIMIFIANGILKLLRQETIRQGPFFTADEIKAMVAIGEEEGILEEEERKMIHGVLELGDTIAKEVMVPRTDMVCVSSDKTIGEALEIAQEAGFSRIPVYEDNLDNVVGILYVKDMLDFVRRGKLNVLVKDLAREPYFVPETKRVDELLREFQMRKIHMAIVIDEYGGTAGLVTLEDLIEEIVGEIFDEYDFEEEKRIEQISEEEWVFDGRVDIDAVEELLGVEIKEEEAETIGGFVTSLLGHVPEEGEKVVYEGHEFMVTQVEKKRVLKVKVRKLPEPEESDVIGKLKHQG